MANTLLEWFNKPVGFGYFGLLAIWVVWNSVRNMLRWVELQERGSFLARQLIAAEMNISQQQNKLAKLEDELSALRSITRHR